MEDGKGRVNNTEIEFDEVVSTTLNQGLNSIDFPGVLIYPRIVCEKKKLCIRYPP